LPVFEPDYNDEAPGANSDLAPGIEGSAWQHAEE